MVYIARFIYIDIEVWPEYYFDAYYQYIYLKFTCIKYLGVMSWRERNIYIERKYQGTS